MAPKMCSGIDGAHAAAQRRQQRQKKRKAQVLKQANRHGEPAVGAVVFGLLSQLRDDDGRRGHRDRAADHHGDRGRHREEQDGACGHRARGDQHLRAADAQHFPAHRDQARQ